MGCQIIGAFSVGRKDDIHAAVFKKFVRSFDCNLQVVVGQKAVLLAGNDGHREACAAVVSCKLKCFFVAGGKQPLFAVSAVDILGRGNMYYVFAKLKAFGDDCAAYVAVSDFGTGFGKKRSRGPSYCSVNSRDSRQLFVACIDYGIAADFANIAVSDIKRHGKAPFPISVYFPAKIFSRKM